MIIFQLFQDIKARLRGEKRAAPSGSRGRVYSRPEAKVSVRVKRAGDDKWQKPK